MRADFLPSIIKQGTYNHHLYSLGQFDSGLGIYANKQYLSEAGVRIPTIDNPWTLTEFNYIAEESARRAVSAGLKDEYERRVVHLWLLSFC